MLRSLKGLEHYTVRATDGAVGTVINFLFDDERWAVRHFVVETSGVFDGRRVLISPMSFQTANWSTRCFDLALSTEKIRRSPSIDVDKPVSRQHEADYYGYYGYPYYWGSGGIAGMGAYPGLLAAGTRRLAAQRASNNDSNDVHLRSASEVRGYHVQGKDDAIGHVADFLVDDDTWDVRYIVVDTTNWWFGKKVLVSPHWAHLISWIEKTVYFDLSRQAIKDSPEWNPEAGINRGYESRLYDYYGRPVYWDSSARPTGSAPHEHVATHPR